MVIEVDLQQLPSAAVIDFCTTQTNLKSISCAIKGSTDIFASFFLMALLTNCLHLRTLKVVVENFSVSYEFFRALVSSKLESLSMVSPNLTLEPQITTEREWPVNKYLRSLNVPLNSGHDFKSLFIKVFPKLKFIRVDGLSDMLINTIRELQVSCNTLFRQ